MTFVVFALALVTSAVPAAPTVEISECAASLVDRRALTEALLVEGAADVRLQLDCGVGPALIEVRLERRGVPVALRAISLSDVDIAVRPRTLALAIAEAVRRLPPPSAVVASDGAPRLRSPAQLRKIRLTRNLAWSFGAISLVTISIGGALVGVPPSPVTDQPLPGFIPAGGTLLAIGGAALIGAAVSLGLWVKARGATPEMTVQLAPSLGGFSLRGSF